MELHLIPRFYFSCLYHLFSMLNTLNLHKIAAKVLYPKDAGFV